MGGVGKTDVLAPRGGFTKLPNSLWAAAVSPEAKLTYAAIASFAFGAKTTAWPSQTTLAGRTGYCERSIRRFTAELEAAGLVRVERRSGRASLYALAAPVGESGAASYPGQGVRRPRPEGPAAPDQESAEEDQGKTTNEQRSSSDVESAVEGQSRIFDAWDAESWTLVPDHLKVSVPGVAVFHPERTGPTSRGRGVSPAEYWSFGTRTSAGAPPRCARPQRRRRDGLGAPLRGRSRPKSA